MRFFTTRIAALCCALAGTALAGDPFNVTVMYQDNGLNLFSRAWYGDGNLYVGSTVPQSVQTAFNFTVPNERADFLYIEALTPGTSPIPDPTFLVVNNAPDAADAVFFSHSAADLTTDDIFFWIDYSTILFPILQDGSIQSYFFLDATGTPGTYIVKWKTGGLKQAGKVSQGSLTNVSIELITRSST